LGLIGPFFRPAPLLERARGHPGIVTGGEPGRGGTRGRLAGRIHAEGPPKNCSPVVCPGAKTQTKRRQKAGGMGPFDAGGGDDSIWRDSRPECGDRGA